MPKKGNNEAGTADPSQLGGANNPATSGKAPSVSLLKTSPATKVVSAKQQQQQSMRQQVREKQAVLRRAERQKIKVAEKSIDIQGVPSVCVKVPAAWAGVWLRTLCHFGAVVVGEQESVMCTTLAGAPCFPQDFPTTQAYWYVNKLLLLSLLAVCKKGYCGVYCRVSYYGQHARAVEFVANAVSPTTACAAGIMLEQRP